VSCSCGTTIFRSCLCRVLSFEAPFFVWWFDFCLSCSVLFCCVVLCFVSVVFSFLLSVDALTKITRLREGEKLMKGELAKAPSEIKKITAVSRCCKAMKAVVRAFDSELCLHSDNAFAIRLEISRLLSGGENECRTWCTTQRRSTTQSLLESQSNREPYRCERSWTSKPPKRTESSID